MDQDSGAPGQVCSSAHSSVPILSDFRLFFFFFVLLRGCLVTRVAAMRKRGGRFLSPEVTWSRARWTQTEKVKSFLTGARQTWRGTPGGVHRED